MEQHQDGFVSGTEYESWFRNQSENENLLNNLKSLRRTLWDMRAQICQLERVLDEARSIQADVDCLRLQINSTAEKFGREPIPGREEPSPYTE